MVNARGRGAGQERNLGYRDLAFGWGEIIMLLEPPVNAITEANDIRLGNVWGQMAVVSILTARSDSSNRQNSIQSTQP
jgi:hypothetical protein